MNIDEVLLTPKEMDELINKAGSPSRSTVIEWTINLWQSQHKTQCLKLLEWLGQECDTQSHNADVIEHECERYHCHFCIAEIEKLLKEQLEECQAYIQAQKGS